VIRHRKHVEENVKRNKLRQHSKADGTDGNQILLQGQIGGVVTMEGLPVVIISHFSSRVGSHRQEIPEILTEWAANLVEKQVLTQAGSYSILIFFRRLRTLYSSVTTARMRSKLPKVVSICVKEVQANT
jgi:hypothetical protein